MKLIVPSTGLLAPEEVDIHTLTCFSDCKELILLLNSDGQVNFLRKILSNIRFLVFSFDVVSFYFISRFNNVSADALAKAALYAALAPP